MFFVCKKFNQAKTITLNEVSQPPSKCVMNRKSSPSFLSISHTHISSQSHAWGFAWNESVFRGFTGPLADGVGCGWLNQQPRGHCATRQPCGILSSLITQGTAYPPTSTGVISCWSNHTQSTPPTWLPSSHIINTRGYHLFSACLALLCPYTEVMNLQELDSCRRGVTDWLLTSNSDPINCLGH